MGVAASAEQSVTTTTVAVETQTDVGIDLEQDLAFASEWTDHLFGDTLSVKMHLVVDTSAGLQGVKAPGANKFVFLADLWGYRYLEDKHGKNAAKVHQGVNNVMEGLLFPLRYPTRAFYACDYAQSLLSELGREQLAEAIEDKDSIALLRQFLSSPVDSKEGTVQDAVLTLARPGAFTGESMKLMAALNIVAARNVLTLADTRQSAQQRFHAILNRTFCFERSVHAHQSK